VSAKLTKTLMFHVKHWAPFWLAARVFREG